MALEVLNNVEIRFDEKSIIVSIGKEEKETIKSKIDNYLHFVWSIIFFTLQ